MKSGRHGMPLVVCVLLGLAIAVGLATAASPFASSSPDGLEHVAGEQGFDEQARLHAFQQDSPVPDYAFPGVEDERLATGLAGFVGTLIVFGLGFGIAFALRRTRNPAAGTPTAT